MQIQRRSVQSVHLLSFSGRFDSHTATAARKELDQCTAARPAFVVVNLAEVSFLDSTGLAALVRALKRAQALQGGFSLCCLQPSVRLIFELTRLDKVFDIYSTEEDALEAFSSIDAPREEKKPIVEKPNR